MDPESAQRVINFVEQIHGHGWDVAGFVQFGTKHFNALNLQRDYVNGKITLRELEMKLGNG